MSFSPSRLRSIRQERGYSQRTLSLEINSRIYSISKWENGRAVPTALKLEQLADTLQCRIDDFFDREEAGDG